MRSKGKPDKTPGKKTAGEPGHRNEVVPGTGPDSIENQAGKLNVSGIDIEWDSAKGTCTFEDLPVAMLWIDTTLKGLMAGMQSMVGTERFALALQSEGRKSVEADWQVISSYPDFREGFQAIANIAAAAGWGSWKLVSVDRKKKKCKFRAWNTWEGLYQKALGVCWGSGMLAGKMAGFCSQLFGTDCWADQTAFIARGDEYDEFEVHPSDRSIEKEIENLLSTDHATRADMAVAMNVLIKENAVRKHTEEALKQSEEKYRELVQNANSIILKMDTRGVVTFFNEYAQAFFGYSEEEITGRNVVGTIVPETDTSGRDLKKMVLDIGRHPENFFRNENENMRRNGERVWISWTNKPVYDKQGKVAEIICIGNDITALNRTQKALRENEQFNETVFNAIQDGISVRDRDLNVIKINQWMENKYAPGMPLVGKKCYSAFQRRSTECPWCPAIPTMETGRPHRETVPYPSEDNPSGWFELSAYPLRDDNGDIVGAVEHVKDITEQKQAEEALRQSEERFKVLAESLPQTVFECDLSGNLTYANSHAFDWFGYSRSDFEKGLSAFQMLAPEERANAMENFKKRLRGETTQDYEYRAVKKDGTLSPILLYSSPIVSGDKVVGLRGIIVDISERKQLEEERARASKLESIGLLAGGIAHDFNNILTSILSNIEMAKMQADKKEQVDSLLSTAVHACLRAKDLTQQLLTFSKGGAPDMKTIRLPDLVKETADFALRGSNVRCNFYFEKDIWPVEGDEGQISQVINNLVINADQAMPEGGTIDIRLENVTVEPHQFPTLADGKYINITIIDQGIGIPSKVLSKIFDPYFTTKQKGSGLGLATAYSIVKRHDGHIAVESVQGIGTAFNIYLPASGKKARAVEKKISLSSAYKGKILIMDDDDTVRTTIGRALKLMGHEVLLAEKGEDAVELYQDAFSEGKPLDAVILDLTIRGGMGGKDTIRKLLEIDPEVKAIVSSGYSNDPVIANFRKYGFTGVVRKPYKIERLSDELQSILEARTKTG
ncbi:MAG: PAS domain S-box protein [Candidatus Glassbacteria bacterium]|nr:PAS domain S-box protein [Candidatus Glassbacteria bacterium]